MPQRLNPARSPERAAELVRGVETLVGKLADPEIEIPLTLMERLERALHLGHRANLMRLGVISERVLSDLEPES